MLNNIKTKLYSTEICYVTILILYIKKLVKKVCYLAHHDPNIPDGDRDSER